LSNPDAASQHSAGTLQGLALTFPITLTVMGIVLLAPILPQMHAHFADVPNADFLVPLVLTIPAACIALFSPVAGWLADRFGRRRLLMTAIGCYAVLGVAPYFLDSLASIFVTRVGLGMTEAVIITVSTTLLGDMFSGGQRDRWLANQTAVASLSALALFVIGGALGVHGWRAPFLVYLSSLVMLAGVWLFTWEPRASTRRAGSDRSVPLPWKRLLGICSVTLLASIFFYILQVQMGVALTERGVTSSATIGWLTSIASLGVPAGTFVFRYAARRLSTAGLLALEFGIIAVGFVGMTHAPDYRTFMLFGALNQLGCGMILPTLLTWAVRGLVFANRGRGTGVWQSVFSVGQTLSALAIPAMARLIGSGAITPTFQYFGYAAFAAAALALAASLRREFLAHAEADALGADDAPVPQASPGH
jgi:MFS family permease